MGVYDESRAKCCSDRKIVKKLPVCGFRQYDQCTQICCDGIIHQKIDGTTCCGQKTYNIKAQICCNKIPQAKFKCKRVFNLWQYSLRNAEAVCHPNFGLRYRLKHDESCHGKFNSVPFRNGRCQLFQIDTIPIRSQGVILVSIPNFDTDASKFSTVLLTHIIVAKTVLNKKGKFFLEYNR